MIYLNVSHSAHFTDYGQGYTKKSPFYLPTEGIIVVYEEKDLANTLGKTIKTNFYIFTHLYRLNLNIITILALQIHSYNHMVDSNSVFRESCSIPVQFWHTNVQTTFC